VLALASCLLVAVFIEARRRFGAGAAAAALFLAAFSPDVLAHGTIVTTDLGFALFFFLAVATFSRLLERFSWLRLLVAGLFTGAAFATKFSAPILIPVLGLLGILAVLGQGTPAPAVGGEGRRLAGPGARARHVLFLLAATFVLALGVLWASYGFRYALSPVPEVRAAQRGSLDAPPASPVLLPVIAAARAHLVPEDYARGLLFVMVHSEARPTFLLGDLSARGFPQYFLVTFLVKTPIPLILLVLLALTRAARLQGRDAVFLWLPVSVYVALTATRGLQIGHRHLLPVYPFLFLAAGEGAAGLWRWLRPLGPGLVLLLATWYAGGTLRTHPHHLAYFNEIVGGPANGWRVLVDSNLDWGQDLRNLATWMRGHGLRRVGVSYFGSAPPDYYGIDGPTLPGYTAPHATHVTREVRPGDVVAISATNLQGVYLDEEDRSLMARFRTLSPIGRAGYSILIYRADFTWPESAGAERGAGEARP
jgi:4-amino-4-deoxy-L-arabinose transferase-like glycosyltransferase